MRWNPTRRPPLFAYFLEIRLKNLLTKHKAGIYNQIRESNLCCGIICDEKTELVRVFNVLSGNIINVVVYYWFFSCLGDFFKKNYSNISSVDYAG